MCLYISLVVSISFFLFSVSSTQIPEYATRVNTAFRFPIPYPTPTNEYNTHQSSLTPLSVSQDWSTPSDYSLWIIQTDNYSPVLSETSVPILNTLLESTMSSFAVNDGNAASSTLNAVDSAKTSENLTGAQARTTTLIAGPVTGLPKLTSTKSNQETTRNTASAPLSTQSTGGVASQPSVAAIPIGAVAAAALGIAAWL
ncbi:MAG: hypothetical protein HETSPECPRED_003187 [Heterodermia speciosa]|uniref:Uncharacterized protein n=1 Tax=Heterodermia speciosa TaxID=116794 RepID=A0A8H3F554_9LECA|nr:MAG: hypothetical protein HETSPECPRED_003187 [Heterodermia speciosa]